MKWKYIPEHRPTLILIILLCISISLLAFNLTKKIWTLRYFVYYVFNPVPELALKIIDNSKYLSENLLSIVKLKEENRELKERLNKLLYMETEYNEVITENKRLKELLELKKGLTYDIISARVISHDPFNWFRAITIDKGHKDGIVVDAPVVTVIDYQIALVGKTVIVDENTTRILLLTDTLLAVPAKVLRTGDNCLIQGNGTPKLILDYLLQESVINIGDEIVTSGIGEIYPSGIPIGIVTDIKTGEEEYFKHAIVKPKVAINRISEVFILKKVK